MTRTFLALTAVLAITFLAAPAFAQDPLASKVTVDLKAVSPEQAFRNVSSVIGMKVTVDPKLTTPLDILVRDVTARTALTAMCESIGCSWSVKGGVIVVTPGAPASPAVVSLMTKQTGGTSEQKTQLLERMKEALKQPLPAGLRFENAPLSEVSARLSEALALTITVTSEDPGIRTVTADFSNKTLVTALTDLGSAGSNPPSMRLTVGYPREPGGPVTPSVMLGIRMAPKKK